MPQVLAVDQRPYFRFRWRGLPPPALHQLQHPGNGLRGIKVMAMRPPTGGFEYFTADFLIFDCDLVLVQYERRSLQVIGSQKVVACLDFS